MEMTITQVASQRAVSRRAVTQAIGGPTLHEFRRIGGLVTIDSIAVRAWDRCAERGRPWEPSIRDAAFALMSGEECALDPSRRWRLRRQLGAMSARRFAHAVGGLDATGYGRYTTLPAPTHFIGPSSERARHLNLTGSSRMTFVETPDLTRFELEHDVTLDAEGLAVVLERDSNPSPWREWVDVFLLGDARESAAAEEQITAALETFR